MSRICSVRAFVLKNLHFFFCFGNCAIVGHPKIDAPNVCTDVLDVCARLRCGDVRAGIVSNHCATQIRFCGHSADLANLRSVPISFVLIPDHVTHRHFVPILYVSRTPDQERAHPQFHSVFAWFSPRH